ncbi:MAG: hypothetical protein ACYC2O_00200 [Microthrixaceae bacterium]
MVRLDGTRLVLRTVDWSPLVVVTGAALLAVCAALRFASAAVGTTVGLCVGALAAAVALSTRDPVRELLSAVPESLRRRSVRRDALVGAAALGVVGALGALVALSAEPAAGDTRALGPGPTLALVATGLAAARATERARPGVAAGVGAAVVLVWAAAPMLTPASLRWLTEAWLAHPWVVVAAALAVVWHATRG